MKKRILAFCLALAIAFSVGIIPVLADELEDIEIAQEEDVLENVDGLEPFTEQEYEWEIETTMPFARELPALAVVDDKLYVIGGFIFNPEQYVTSVNIYDLNSKLWEVGTNIPDKTAGYYADAAVVNGKIYVTSYDGAFYEYNPATDIWRKLEDIPNASTLIAQIVAIGQKIYIFSSGTISTFDIETEEWTTQTAPGYIRRYLSAAALEGKIYISGNDTTGSRNLYIYDVAANSWSEGASMNNSRLFGSFVAIDGHIYAIGGQPGANDVESYDPVTDSWRIEPSTVTQRHGASAIAYNGKIYAVGARGEGGDTIEVLYVGENSTPPLVTNRLYVLLNISESVQLSLSHNLGINVDYDWSSTDEAVATVNANGYVTAEGEGTCFIYAESEEGYSDYIPIKVIEGNADEIRLAVHLTVGGTAKLYLAEDPSTVNWSSFDNTVVEVDSEGVLTANGRGLAIVQGEINGEEYHIYVRVNA